MYFLSCDLQPGGYRAPLLTLRAPRLASQVQSAAEDPDANPNLNPNPHPTQCLTLTIYPVAGPFSGGEAQGGAPGGVPVGRRHRGSDHPPPLQALRGTAGRRQRGGRRRAKVLALSLPRHRFDMPICSRPHWRLRTVLLSMLCSLCTGHVSLLDVVPSCWVVAPWANAEKGAMLTCCSPRCYRTVIKVL